MINVGIWSGSKVMIHPTRSEVHITSFTDTGKTCLKRVLLECERRVFYNKTEHIFAESKREFCMNLSNRERALLALDERFCRSRSVFTNVDEWIYCKGELKRCHIRFHAQVKVHEREKLKTSESNNNSDENDE